MALDLNAATTTDYTNNVDDVTVDPQTLDSPSDQPETKESFDNADQNLGDFKEIPEIKSAITALIIYVCGQGLTTDTRTQAQIDGFRGDGHDSFQSICRNHMTMKKALGDAITEIVRDPKNRARVINLKPLNLADMSVIYGRNGRILRYEQNIGTDPPKKFRQDQILHSSNGRFGNEMHGTSPIEAAKKIIDAKNEALTDEKKIRHRELSLGIAYYKTTDEGKIEFANRAIEKAVNKGEMLGLPEKTVEIKDTGVNPRDRVMYMQYLDNLFYQIFNVPKVVATSEGYSEAGAKVGIFTFDPVYTSEQREFEADLWNQAAIKVKFNPAPSLGGTLQDSEAKNTGQTGFQPADTQVNAGRQE